MKLFLLGAGGKIRHIKNFQELKAVDGVIISDIFEWSYGNFVADKSYITPRFDDPSFYTVFDSIYKAEKFDVCIPLHDASLMLVSENREFFSKYPFQLGINCEETITTAADKLLMYQFFVKNDIPTLLTYTVEEFLSLSKHVFPYFIKPRYIKMRGSAQQRYTKIEDEHDLQYILQKIKGYEDQYVVQEFVEGKEVNLDFFCDKSGAVKVIVPVERQAMGASRGISRGEILFEDTYDSFILRIAQNMHLVGANNAQLYVDKEGRIRFTEINPRFSGSSALVKEAGVNFFQYFIDQLLGKEIGDIPKPNYLKMSSWEAPNFFTESPAIHI